ncbi:hypothetical protein CI784_00550 [Arthrobacter agilis]|nr:hypothetical protein CI784_00550 [Arthrobacter agilis]
MELTMENLHQILDHPSALQAVPERSRGPRSRHLLAPAPSPEPDVPPDLAAVSTRDLRLLCNRVYQRLDTAYPGAESREQYHAIVGELEHREAEAEHRGAPESVRETFRDTFRDNALFSRFELFRNGVMAGYVQYDLRGGQVLLLHAVIDPKFRRMGLELHLMQAVLLNAHRRRLAVMPYCPEAQDFLAAHPRYLALLPTRQRRRFTQLMESRAGKQDSR